MKKIALFCVLCCLGISVFAQSSKVFDNLSLPSKILDGDRKYAIYLPPGYDQSTRDYPVLYLLHGGGDDQTGWVQFGEVQHITDKAIQEGKSTPMIIVMPDADTGRRGFFNDIKGDWRYEDFFFEEFLPFIEDKYRIRSEKRYRAVAGLSMGGGGSFMYALHHPELFSSAVPMSASCGGLTVEATRARLTRGGRTLDGITDAQVQTYHEQHSALALVEAMPEDQKNAVRWYIDCGDDDFLYEGNAMVHVAMRKKEIAHEYRVRDGRHSWVYWRQSLPEALHFVSQAFHQN